MPRKIVIKIGGATFFDEGGFQAPLKDILSEYQDDQVFVMVGGGDLIEAMRTAHRIYPSLSTQEMHWTCVELLDVCWKMAKKLYPLDHSIQDREDLDRVAFHTNGSSASWVRVQSFYSRMNHQSIEASWLPSEDWNTTTDALAWLLGMTIHADKVVLVKQCECDPNWTIEQASELGIVDKSLASHFSHKFTESPSIALRSKKS